MINFFEPVSHPAEHKFLNKIVKEGFISSPPVNTIPEQVFTMGSMSSNAYSSKWTICASGYSSISHLE